MNQKKEKSEQKRLLLIWIVLLICSLACMAAIARELYIYLHQAEPMIGVTVKGSNGSELTIAPTGGTTTVKSASGATLEIGFSSFGPPSIAPITSAQKPLQATSSPIHSGLEPFKLPVEPKEDKDGKPLPPG